MGRVTIGEFARASGLSPKALRLYDDLGLLRPAYVDPANGYRFYEDGQLEQARLVAWLRRLGMPLARIRDVCALEGNEGARAVKEFWARAESDHAARRGMAAFLTDHLQAEPERSRPPMGLRYAGLSDRGRSRETHQDAVYAGRAVLAVADGFGPYGEAAGKAAVEVMGRVDLAGLAPQAVPGALRDAVEGARAAVVTAVRAAGRAAGGEEGSGGERAGSAGERAGEGRFAGAGEERAGGEGAEEERAGEDPAGSEHAGGERAGESGSTLTALCWTGSRLALLHVGDGRAYLLRGGRLSRLTEDHTLVGFMVEDGRLTPEEAAAHPQRALLLRALADDGPLPSSADTRLRHVRPGDRYLVCTDGLSAVAAEEDIQRVLAAAAGPRHAVRELVRLAHTFGAPDNIACAVADVVVERNSAGPGAGRTG
ncbi:MerR family transcriptional regulator [Streptantibioticus silvisoli]|uniref:MerR family transcriptional regulator n=1 Tax=Streptantibioticus silvisoli TaxID=2705255 RepID=A0ABT6VYW1_9ACTN|nr:MerR family transcriptional regulator [Streptantibioticus silvisoli]MDI5963656.1 MerR family transcriptional regulator [Streptantibioticus silvisoli]